MSTIKSKRILQHSAANVWAWISDYGNVHRIHPALGSSHVIGTQSCGVGAVRQCNMKMPGMYLKERVTDWKEGQSLSIVVDETTMPMVKTMQATLGVRALGTRSSEVYMDVEYTLGWGPIGAMMNLIMMKPMMKMMIGMLIGKLNKELARHRADNIVAVNA